MMTNAEKVRIQGFIDQLRYIENATHVLMRNTQGSSEVVNNYHTTMNQLATLLIDFEKLLESE